MDKATKEKISEIACLCEGCLEKSYRDIDGCWDCENRGTYYGALKMAEWKQQQMIEKVVGWLKEHCACPNEFLNTFTEAMYGNN